MGEKKHLTSEGLAKIVALKASMNMGLQKSQLLFLIFLISRPSVKFRDKRSH
jgi:hypothetical protein